MRNTTEYNEAYKLSRTLYLKLGEDLSAPINFMPSGAFFTYTEGLSDRGAYDFALGYRDGHSDMKDRCHRGDRT